MKPSQPGGSAGRQSADTERRDFRSLIAQENACLAHDEIKERKPSALEGVNDVVLTEGPAKEPRVPFTTTDRIGLALSGGGVRSATFNLGLLQALSQLKVMNQSMEPEPLLERIHYLATVSGGGYVGAFWTRWRKTQRETPGLKRFPESAPFPCAEGKLPPQPEAQPKETRETWQFRHLREFSRFLIPRKGLNLEFWSAAITILIGVVPALLASLVVIMLGCTLWAILANYGTTQTAPNASLLFPLLLGAAVLRLWLMKPAETYEKEPITWLLKVLAFPACGLAFLGLYLAGWQYWTELPHWHSQKMTETFAAFSFNWSLFHPCCLMLLSFAGLTLFRMLLSWLAPRHAGSEPVRLAWSNSFDRLMGCMLSIQMAWAALACAWEGSRWLVHQAESAGDVTFQGGLGGVTGILLFLFYQVRDWLKGEKTNQSQSSFRKLLTSLKPLAPQLLANASVVLLFILAMSYIIDLSTIRVDANEVLVPLLMVVGFILVVVLLLFDPAVVGLHEFYRARLARCYLGAGVERPTRNWPEQATDDMFLHEDAGRPFHLICCAANQSRGDPLGTLHRGARSAVLSRCGIAVGNDWKPHDSNAPIKLSSSMTASAAAFNSLMGELNVTMGHASSFVMTALNLRLGLWVRNPNPEARTWGVCNWFPGRFFLWEMMGIARCDEGCNTHIHLSDGGHFENLALYELVRRHCRYILVSDAGMDEDFEFSDLGRAIRRIREDFGVEIEIDLSALKPGENGLSTNHLAIGTIHYDGVVGTDKGTLVYLKPSLSGDEPVDVQQYKRRCRAFPHEPTGDQFFDEAQFESYRRLGEHIGYSSLRLVEKFSQKTPVFDETLFHELRLGWQSVPWLQSEAGIRLCSRASELETSLRCKTSGSLAREFLGNLIDGKTCPHAQDTQAQTEQTLEDMLMVIQILKFMEEAFVVCELDRFWSNPRAQSWMSYLHRYAAMPSLRALWPGLKPLYGAPFVDFANDQLHLSTADFVDNNHQGSASIELAPCNPKALQTSLKRRLEDCLPDYPFEGRTCFVLTLKIQELASGKPLDLQVGLVAVKTGPGTVEWNIDDLFVPPELVGGCFKTKLLEKLIEHFQKAAPVVQELKVHLEVAEGTAPNKERLRRAQAGRQEQVELIDFYRSRQFSFDGKTWIKGQNTCMVRSLASRLAATEGAQSG